jgi:hypothetical protein
MLQHMLNLAISAREDKVVIHVRNLLVQGLGVATPHPAAGGRQRRAKKRTMEQGRRTHELVVTGNDVKPNFAIPGPGQDGPALQPRVRASPALTARQLH